MTLFCIGLDLMAIITAFVILIGVILGKKNGLNEYFRLSLLLQSLLLISDMGLLSFSGNDAKLVVMRIFMTLRGSFLMLSIAVLIFYVDNIISKRHKTNKLSRWIPFGLTIGAMLFWISSYWFGLVWSISADMTVEYERFFWVMLVVSGGIVGFELVRILYYHTKGVLENNVAICLYVFILLPSLGLVLTKITGYISLFYALLTLSYLEVCLVIRIQREPVLQEKEMPEVVEKTLYEDLRRAELTLSQLHPHFLVNSMTNIKYMVKKDPDLAEKAIEELTKYLRECIEAVDDNSLIPFSEELEHTKTYFWLEQMRFKNLKIEYDIDVDTFLVPKLTLQPIVENAVRHGVTKKIGGGKISIMTREMKDYYKIVVKDDGVGFDITKEDVFNEDTIGIREIRARLYQMNQSKMQIASTKDVGTTVTYRIMKGGAMTYER